MPARSLQRSTVLPKSTEESHQATEIFVILNMPSFDNLRIVTLSTQVLWFFIPDHPGVDF